MAAWRLGAGRSVPGESVSMTAGVICRAKPGDELRSGQVVVELWGDDPSRLEAARSELDGAIEIGDGAPTTQMVLERIGC